MLFEDNITFLILKVMITCAGTFGMMGSTTKFRSVKEKTISIMIFASYIIYVIISSYAIIYFFSYQHLLRVFILTISCPAILLLHNVSDEPFPRLVFIRATHILISLYIAGTITLINTALHGTELSDILMRLLVYLIVILLDFHFIRCIYLDFITEIKKGWGILSLIPCSLILLAVAIAFYPEHYSRRPSSVVMIYLLGIVIVILYAAIGAFLSMQYHRQEIEQNRKILELQVQNIQRAAADMEKLAKQTKIIRHDTRHILSTIASLAESGDTQAILDFTSIAGQNPDIPESTHYCTDALLDTTLYSYFKSAEGSGILLQTSIAIPDILPVDSAGLAICFANALGNAIECCEKLPREKRTIIFKCIAKPKLMLEIKNPQPDRITFDKNGLPHLPEGGMETHIRSIVAFCKEYDAFYSFTVENGWFKVMVTI